MTTRVRWGLGVGLCILVLATTGLLTHAGDPPDELTGRVARLETAIAALEKRVAVLEQGPKPGATVPRDKAVWRRLRQGMSAEEVRQLLGEPKRVDSGPALTYWYYSESGGTGPYVLFSSDSLTVNGWTEPK